MRLWSIHPRYLDCKGLIAVWREGLLARKVLLGETEGYKNHPQLERFKNHEKPIAAIDAYLLYIWEESENRCYRFDKKKIGNNITQKQIEVTTNQIEYEFEFLKSKIKKRDPKFYKSIMKEKTPSPNSLFKLRNGPVASWEKIR